MNTPAAFPQPDAAQKSRTIHPVQERTLRDFLFSKRLKDTAARMVAQRPALRNIDPETFAQTLQVIKSRGKAFRADRQRNVDICLRLLGDLGLDETILIHHDKTGVHAASR